MKMTMLDDRNVLRCFLISMERHSVVMRSIGLPLIALVLASCASFDPHNVISRRTLDSATRTVDGFVPLPSEYERFEMRRQNVEQVWKTVRDRYYRADLNGVDWNAARAKWEPLIVNAESEDLYWERLDRFAGELADSHTRVESPAQVEARRRQRVLSLGLGLREIDGRLVVLAVNAESDAHFAGIRAGMALTAIGEVEALKQWREWIASARKSSTDIATRNGAMRKLNDLARTASDGIEIEFERFDGSREKVRLKSRAISTRPSVSYRVLPSGFGYVKLTAFSEALRSELLSAIVSLKDTPGMVLDLRGNGGGSAAMAQALVGAFFKEKTVIGKATTRSNEPVTLAFGAVKLIQLERVVPGRADAYAGKLVVLIDHGSASASEVVASALQSTKRAQIVGETSCGCLLAFLGYASLQGGGELAYSEVGYYDIGGQAIENRGVTPNSSIIRSIDDVRASRDRVLEAAVALLPKASR
jgi:carboxyl-terminal processing protease